MDQLIQLLRENARHSIADLADLMNLSEKEVESKLAELEESGTILGYTAVFDADKVNDRGGVSALIEVKLTPERGGGFDRLAARIAKFDEVESCMLMSGGYDLSVVISGSSLHEVASFVAEKLSTLEGVISTATHFQLKSYKSNGFLARVEHLGQRLPVSP
jgi:DNA-binding Lrp family transcriptional regulator